MLDTRTITYEVPVPHWPGRAPPAPAGGRVPSVQGLGGRCRAAVTLMTRRLTRPPAGVKPKAQPQAGADLLQLAPIAA